MRATTDGAIWVVALLSRYINLETQGFQKYF